jgi:O-antigen/teichoic acid export membrane protein
MDSRLQNVVRGSVASFMSRVIIFGLNFTIISILSRHLDPENFGKWTLIHQAALMVSVFDFGIGGGALRNALVTQVNRRELFFSMFYFALLIFIPLACLSTPWLMGAITLILVRAPFAICGMGFYAYEESHLKGWLEAGEISGLLLAVYLAAAMRFQLRGVVALYYCTYAGTMLITFFHFLRRRKWKFMPYSYQTVKKRVAPLFRESLLFWGHSLFSILLFSASPFLVAKVTNIRLAGEYSLLMRLFGVLLGVQFALMTPLWSAFTKARYAGEFAWVTRTFKRSFILTLLLLCGGGLFLCLFHSQIILLWTGKVVNEPGIVVLLALSVLIQGGVQITSILLNSLSKLKRQISFLAVGSLLQITLAFFVFSGIKGVVLSQLFSYLPLLVSNLLEVNAQKSTDH